MLKKILTTFLFTLACFQVSHAQQEIKNDTSTTIIIRDAVYTGTEPLYILSGKIIDKKTLDAIKPETIERIDILKGESATAIYGERAKNGAVIITLKGQNKKGKKSKS